jgi:hypothetical protein
MAVAISAEEEVVIKKRLLTQTAVARGNADPPLKKLTKRCAAATARIGGHHGLVLVLRAGGGVRVRRCVRV